MPAGNFTVYAPAMESIHKGAIDLDTDNFNAILVTSSYTPNANTDDTYSDVSANELATANGYTVGGISLGAMAVTRSGAVVTVDNSTNPSWTAAGTLTAKYCVVSKRAGGSLVAGDLLLGYVDLETGGGSVSATNAAFTVTWNVSGLFTVTRT